MTTAPTAPTSLKSEMRRSPRHPDRSGTIGRARRRRAEPAGRTGRSRPQRRPVPGGRDGRGGVRLRQRHPDRALLPVRLGHAARRVHRPGGGQPGPRRLRAHLRVGAVRHRGWGGAVQPTCWTCTAGTATASSTWRSRWPTSTAASPTPARRVRRSWSSRTTSRTSTESVRIAAIATYGHVRHTLVDRSRYTGPVSARLRRPAHHPGPTARCAATTVPGPRSCGRQRRAGPDERLGRRSTTR